MEADFNFKNKVLAKEAIRYTKSNNLIPKEQYSSRKKHRASYQAMNKQILCDISYLNRKAMVLCSNDAKSYYDRIVYSIVSLALQQFGMPIELIKSIFCTIQQLKHVIYTAFRDSV